jgi:hypothetical protein
MDKHYKTEGRYSYYEAGEGTPLSFYTGYADLANFDAVTITSTKDIK